MKSQAITPDSNHSGVELLKGYSIKEDAGAAATIELREAAVGGAVIAYINFAANESVQFEFDEPWHSEGGVYVNEVTGSITGVLWSVDG